MNHNEAVKQLGSWQGYTAMDGYEDVEAGWALYWGSYFWRNETSILRAEVSGQFGRDWIDFSEAHKACPKAFKFGLADTESDYAVADYLRLRMDVLP